MGSGVIGRGRRPVFVTVLALALLTTTALLSDAGRAQACAFLRTPFAFEAEAERASYLATIEAASVDALFPGDPYFGVPALEAGSREARVDGAGGYRLPATILKAIAWEESALTMASRATPFLSTGPALVSFDCGHGVMQITTGMTVPLGEGSQATDRQVNVATHYAYNITRGAVILAEKWNQAPEDRPIAGSDSGGDPAVVENWYFAVWGYNGFTGPGSNSSNHPLDPGRSAWPRPAYQCDGSQARNSYPYQELIWGCMANPPVRAGAALWAPLPASQPDFTQPQYLLPLAIKNWAYPYSAMDMPTPQPAHTDVVPSVAPDFRQRTLASPSLGLSTSSVTVRLDGTPQDARAEVMLHNSGTGILSWAATADENWIVIDPPAGVALGGDLGCQPPECSATAELTITVNPTLLPQASAIGIVTITPTNASGSARTLRVEVDGDFEVAAPGTSRAY